MRRLLLAALLLTGSVVTYVQTGSTFARFQEDGGEDGSFQAWTEGGVFDPGFAYLDHGCDEAYDDGTDQRVPRTELVDGRYETPANVCLVLPPSEEPITAFEIALGSPGGGLTIATDLTATTAPMRLEAEYGRIRVATGVGLQASAEVRVEASSVALVGASVTSTQAMVTVEANGPVLGQRANLLAHEGLTVEAVGSIDVERATLTSERATLRVEGQAELRAHSATLEARDDLSLESIETMDVREATVRSHEGLLSADKGSDETTLLVGSALLYEPADNDKLAVSPSTAGVQGMPAHGGVE